MAQLQLAFEAISTLSSAMVDLGHHIKIDDSSHSSDASKISKMHAQDANKRQHRQEQGEAVAISIGGNMDIDNSESLPMMPLVDWMPNTSMDTFVALCASRDSLVSFVKNRKSNGISASAYASFCHKVSRLIKEISDYSANVLRSEMDRLHSQQDQTARSVDIRPTSESVDAIADQFRNSQKLTGVYGADDADDEGFISSAPSTPYETPAVSASSSRASTPPLEDEPLF